MARNSTILMLRTTRSRLNAQAAALNLKAGEPYFITDENRFALGLSTSTYEVFAKQSEVSGVVSTSISVDFGTLPLFNSAFYVAVPGLVVNSKVFITVVPDSDEYEMDSLTVNAYCKTAGFLTLYVTANPGPVNGIKTFNYFLG